MSAIRLLPVPGTYATLDIEVPAGDWDTHISAVTEGNLGNQITFAATADAVRSFLDLDAETQDLDTIVEAVELYTLGDDITVEVLGDSGAAEGVVIVEDLVARTVVIHFETAVSTVLDVETAIGATATLIQVKTAGTAATVLDAATDETVGAINLASGVVVGFEVSGYDIEYHYSDGETTVADFEADLLDPDVSGSEDAAALIRVTTAGTAATVLDVAADDFTATPLAAGGATSSAAPDLLDATLGVKLPHLTDEALLLLRNVDVVAGTTKTATGTLWGYSNTAAGWYVIGAVNGGAAIAEVAADTLAHAELITGLRRFSRVYFQIGTLGGAGTEIDVWLDCVPADTTTS